MEVAVVGGGAVGVTVAYDLAARDVAVTVFERDRPGAGASGRAAGVCYPAYADPLDAELATRAMGRFRTFADGFTFVEHPYVWAAHADDERRCEAIREQVDRMRANGLSVETLAPATAAERFPGLRTDRLGVAAVAHDAAYAAPDEYVADVAARAERAGATVRTGTPVGVRTDPPGVCINGSTRGFDAVVVAAGAHTGRLLADADAPIAMAPYRVQALIAAPRPEGAIPMFFDATEGYYTRPWHGGGLLIGDGTEPVAADPEEWAPDADAEFVATARERLARGFGLSAVEVRRAWAGLCTATPDGDPLVGERRPGVYVATGWQGHGFMRAPAIAEVVVADVLEDDGIDAFDPTRFDGTEPIEIVEGMAIEVDSG